MKFQEEVFGKPFTLSFRADMIDNKAIDLHMGFVQKVNVIALTDANLNFNWQGGSQGVGTLGKFTANTGSVQTTYDQLQFSVTGLMPYGIWYLPMKALRGPDSDVLSTREFRRIELETTSSSNASTSATPSIIAEYMVYQ